MLQEHFLIFYVPEWQKRQFTFSERAQSTQEIHNPTSMFDNKKSQS